MESTQEIDFAKYWRILKRRWLPAVATFGSVVTLTTVYTFSKAPIYRAQGQLIFKQDQTPSLIGLDSAEKANFQNDKSLINTEIRVISSDPSLQKTLDTLNQSNLQGSPIRLSDLHQGIEIKNIEKTDILEVAYKSKDPTVAALVANQLMNTYVNNNLWANRFTAISAGNFITGQLPLVKASVNRAALALRSFKEKYRITDLEQTKTLVAQDIDKLQNQVDTVENQLADLNSRSRGLQQQLGMNSQEALARSSVSQSLAVQGVLADLQKVQLKLADARALYKEENPVITHLKDQEAQFQTLLQNQVPQVLQGQKNGPTSKLQIGQTQQELMNDLLKIEMNRRGLVTQMATLSNQKAFYQRQAAILPGLEQEQRELARKLSAAESTYEVLLKNLQQIKVKENETVGNVRIVEPAKVPREPIAPNKPLAIAAGGLAGILLAAAVIYVLEVQDKKIKTIIEARNLFEYNLLGTIPVFSKTTRTVDFDGQTSEQMRLPLPMIQSPCSPISESYRRLQANLKFLNSDQALKKVIVVTSAVPKEGKSTTCANLAAAMAELGHRTLIIDADMRRPSQHQFWQISNTVGLSNVIAGQDYLGGTITQSVMKNLDILTSGSLPPNQVVLLDSKRLSALIEECRQQYDYVLIDTPPLAIAADAPILGKMADGVLLVTRPGIADFTSSKFAKEYLDQSGQNVLGIVVNAVIPEHEPSSYFYYYSAEYNKESGSKELASVGKVKTS